MLGRSDGDRGAAGCPGLWRSTHALDPYKPLASEQPALRVQVIGYDWKWLFIYPDEGVASIGELAIPAGRPVAMQLTSATVMQSLQIPALGSQIYAMGGMVTQLHLEATKPGRFMGENTMYNGNGFSPAEVHRGRDDARCVPGLGAARSGQAAYRMDAGHPQAAISKRTTRAQLIAAVGKAESSDGNVYFSARDGRFVSRGGQGDHGRYRGRACRLSIMEQRRSVPSPGNPPHP